MTRLTIQAFSAVACLLLAGTAAAQSIEAARAAQDEGRFIEAARLGEALGTSDGYALAAESLAIHGYYVAGEPEKEALFERAMGLAEEAIRLDPANPEARLQSAHAMGRYAQTIGAAGFDFDMLYGPAYKGIPLVASVAIAWFETVARDVPYAFNRKEEKDHGEGGMVVGAPLRGRVLIVDDVMSAGTAARESLAIIRAAGAVPVGFVISLDREERGGGRKSAAREMREDAGLPVAAVANAAGLLRAVEARPDLASFAPSMRSYLERYGDR